jgi:serine/threonine protein kinase
MKRIFLDQDTNQNPLNEVKLLETLNHPNIIKYLETFEHNGNLCIIMEYAENGDLKEKVKAAI